MSSDFNYPSAKDVMDGINKIVPQYGGITWARLNATDKGLQWPCPTPEHPGTPFLHKDGKFSRGKGLFTVIPHKDPAEMPDAQYPFILSTGRMLWHYHTGTMSRRSPTLNARAPENYVEVSPDDAVAKGIVDGQKVKLWTRRGEITVKVKVTDRVSKGLLFLPFHYVEAPANALTIAALDPVAKIPEYKVCAANFEKI